MKKYLVLLYTLTLMSSCQDENGIHNSKEDQFDGHSAKTTATVNLSEKHQVIESFGASDCMVGGYVGEYWTNQRKEISDLLFSMDKGIGLSMWRFNLGGGSRKQGTESGIDAISNRADSFLDENGEYDWNRCVGQRYFLEQAKANNVDQFILFSNTPLVEYTKNGLGTSSNVTGVNIKDDCYDDFADYMAKVAKYFNDKGIRITGISPVNEPQHKWNSSTQEGCHWTNKEMVKLIRELDAKLTENKVTGTLIYASEAASWDFLYDVKFDQLNSKASSDVIDELFDNSKTETYIGDLPHVAPVISGHSYWTDGDWNTMRDVRLKLAKKANERAVKVWQTEWSMLGKNYSTVEFMDPSTASELEIALYMSKVIHNDLTIANVTSWSYWTALNIDRWGHKNRFLLIKLHTVGGQDDYIDREGSISPTKTLWVLGNYSRFIRPGYNRITLSMPDENHRLFASAWASEDSKRVVAVYTNIYSSKINVDVTKEHFGKIKTVDKYTTSADKDLHHEAISDGEIVLEPKSVTTVVYNLE